MRDLSLFVVGGGLQIVPVGVLLLVEAPQFSKGGSTFPKYRSVGNLRLEVLNI